LRRFLIKNFFFNFSLRTGEVLKGKVVMKYTFSEVITCGGPQRQG
jgi:hypothetical protein